jgi:hypothetical protein
LTSEFNAVVPHGVAVCNCISICKNNSINSIPPHCYRANAQAAALSLAFNDASRSPRTVK